MSEVKARPEEFTRGKPMPPQGTAGGYDQNWYPIALSRDVKAGEVHGTEFLNGKVIVVRDENGKAQVLSAYCRHLGADLSDADLAEADLSDADLSHANLTGANLTRAKLTNVFYDATTTWPQGFTAPPSRAVK